MPTGTLLAGPVTGAVTAGTAVLSEQAACTQPVGLAATISSPGSIRSGQTAHLVAYLAIIHPLLLLARAGRRPNPGADGAA
ncbi:MAG: hypothetical protein ACR2FG_12720 [Marmoricola sp.]